MSFPRLAIEYSNYTITSIKLKWDASDSFEMGVKPQSLIRQSHNVTRDVRLSSVSSGTKMQYPDVPYDQVRLIHTWIGYADVMTQSVALSELSDEQTSKNLFAIYNCSFAAPTMFHSISFLNDNDFPASSPALYGTVLDAFFVGNSWSYGQTAATLLNTVKWFVKDVDIYDNQNNTSRVTFTFETIGNWSKLTQVIS